MWSRNLVTFGPAAHHCTPDLAFTAPAFLAAQHGNAVALPFQSDMRGDMVFKGLIECIEGYGY